MQAFEDVKTEEEPEVARPLMKEMYKKTLSKKSKEETGYP